MTCNSKNSRSRDAMGKSPEKQGGRRPVLKRGSRPAQGEGVCPVSCAASSEPRELAQLQMRKGSDEAQGRHGHEPGGVPGEFAPMRLQKFLARAGVASRRHCEELIASGRVSVNGQTVTEMGFKVDPASDAVALDGDPVSLGEAPVTIMLNKPAGFVTTMSDPEGRRCVADLVPLEQYPGLFPVGRLDCDTTGLLLFTNDGQLGYRLAHPKHHVDKTYVAHVKGRAGKKQISKLRRGVTIRGGLTSPAKVREIGSTPEGSILEITIHEGMNRQVRRMCSAVGLPVLELERIAMGTLHLDGIRRGCWRVLSDGEVEELCKAASLGE